MSCWLCIPTPLKGCLGRKPFCSFLMFSAAYFHIAVLFVMDKLKEKCRALLTSRTCLGCFLKSRSTLGLNEPPEKVVNNQCEIVLKKPNIADGIWSTSTPEIDVSQPRELYGNSDDHKGDFPQFINHGLVPWNQTREQWAAKRRNASEKQIKDPSISWNATYEDLLSTSKPFPRPIPLTEMVEFLVNVWEQEGLYD